MVWAGERATRKVGNTPPAYGCEAADSIMSYSATLITCENLSIYSAFFKLLVLQSFAPVPEL